MADLSLTLSPQTPADLAATPQLTYQSQGISRTVSRLNAADSQVRHALEQAGKGVKKADPRIVREMVEEIEHGLSEDGGGNTQDQRELLRRRPCDSRKGHEQVHSQKL